MIKTEIKTGWKGKVFLDIHKDDSIIGSLDDCGGKEWLFCSEDMCQLTADELQQIADKLRELNGGATDGQEND